MNYSKIRNRIKSFQSGGIIFQDPDLQSEYEYLVANGYSPDQAKLQITRDAMLDYAEDPDTAISTQFKTLDEVNKFEKTQKWTLVGTAVGKGLGIAALSGVSAMGGGRGAQAMASGILMAANGVEGAGWGIGAGAAVGAMDMIDKATMGDKNFNAQSLAIDTLVHTASSALLKSGNPFAMAAGAAIEGVNFLSKAGGQTVLGYDVDINSSGYGNLGHLESKSSRASILGFKRHDVAGQLARRNEQARMALLAAAISEDQSFEQEARQNNITNVLMQNQQALAGGIELNELV